MRSIICSTALAGLLLLPQAARAAPPVTPEQVQAALPKLDDYVEQAMKQTGVPGLGIAVVHQDRVVYLKGFGVRAIGEAAPVDGDTVFQLASVSKPMATTVLAALVGEGLIDWDDRIIDHDPDFRLYDPWVTRQITFRDALCHRSGLPGHAGDLLEDLGYERGEILRRLRFVKPAYGFRAGYAYTNFVFTEGGVAGARAAGKTWEELCADKLYRPLGMKSTSSRHADYAAAKNRARLHTRVGGKWAAKFDRQPDAQAPAGGASSSARDLAQWLRLQLAKGKYDGKQIVAAAALAETHRPLVISRQPADPGQDRAGFYALGWNVNYDDRGRVRLGHAGAFDLGAATSVNLLPSEDLGILVLTNAAPIGVAEAIANSFFDLALAGKVDRDWLALFSKLIRQQMESGSADYSKPPAQPAPALPLAAYAGRYGNDYFGPAEVFEEKGTLRLRMGPKKITLPMRHWDRDVFIYEPVSEMASGGSAAVIFEIGPDRRAASVRIENFDVHGQGTFRRLADKK
jgi:CubicO group peptidase (beta-lactamase class C family)